ncbi:MAG: phosphoribosyltransferase family protein [Salibacteraceae bacterium]
MQHCFSGDSVFEMLTFAKISGMSDTPTLILNHRQIEQKILRIATEIYENNYQESEIHLVGIADRGYVLAERISRALAAESQQTIHLHKLHIADEFPFEGRWETPEKVAGALEQKVVILVDDVLNSGTTLIYGTRFLLQHPLKQLITTVLVNRRHRLYPVRADYVGLTLATTLQEHISVAFEQGNDAVYLK